MRRLQLSVPDELYAIIKARGLPVVDLLRSAVEAELRRLALLEAHRAYIDELEAELGPPTPAEQRHAEELADRIVGSRARKAG